MAKDPAQFPDIIIKLWTYACASRLPRSAPDDPIFPSCQFLILPSRKKAERVRYLLSHYRASVKRESLNPRLDEETRRSYGDGFSKMQCYSPVLRNPAFPDHSGVARGFYSLPDGPHHVYFRQVSLELKDDLSYLFADEEATLAAALERIQSPLSSHITSTSSPAQRALEDLCYSPATRGKHETVPLSDDELFEEDPSDA